MIALEPEPTQPHLIRDITLQSFLAEIVFLSIKGKDALEEYIDGFEEDGPFLSDEEVQVLSEAWKKHENLIERSVDESLDALSSHIDDLIFEGLKKEA